MAHVETPRLPNLGEIHDMFSVYYVCTHFAAPTARPAPAMHAATNAASGLAGFCCFSFRMAVVN